MTRTTLRPSDRVTGRNPYTGQSARGTITEIVRSDLDSVEYATVSTNEGDVTIDARLLSRDIRRCRRLIPNLDSEGYAPRGSDGVTCMTCGQDVYGYPDWDKDWGTAWTHNPDLIPARFR